jgi:hypothetical protein
MPAKSAKQERFMQAVAHNPAFAKKVGVPQSVGKEFTKAKGGMMANTARMNRLEELGRVNAEKASTAKGKKNLTAEKKRIVGELKMAKGGMAESKGMIKKEVSFMKKKGAPKSMIKHEESEMKGMKKGGMAKYANGGMVGASKMGAVKTAAPSRDGVATKGKTKGTMVKMAGSAKGMKYGGKAC